MTKHTLTTLLLALCAIGAMAQPAANYYTASTLDGKNGRDLELALKAIVYPHQQKSYNSLWTAYETTDPGPSDSLPASHTKSDLVYDMYAWMRQFPKYYSDNDHTQTGGINREHCVPNSWWGGEKGNGVAYTDLHHLVPGDGAANNAKSNWPLGEYASGMSLSWPTATKQNTSGYTYVVADAVSSTAHQNHTCNASHVWNVSNSSNYGGASSVYEPADEYKGDFARMYLYVVCAYEGELTWQVNYMFTSDASKQTTIKPWAKELLLQWHRQDPVSEKERMRNNAVASIQGNRNPFIDYPELVEYIWGNKTSESFSLSAAQLSYNVTDNRLNATGSWSAASATATVGATDNVFPTYSSNSDGEKRYSSSNTDVASISASTGAITLLGAGTTSISCYTMGSTAYKPSATASYTLTVESSQTTIFAEDFASCTTGNNTSNQGSSTRAAIDMTQFSDSAYVYSAGGLVRIGKSGTTGSITTKTLDLSQNGGKFYLAFDVKGWTSKETDVLIQITGMQDMTVSYSALMSNDFDHKELLFTGGHTNSTITFSNATAGGRFFLDNIHVYYDSEGMKEAPDAMWSSSLYVADLNKDDNTYPTFSTTSTAEIVYECDNDDVASIDAYGNICICGEGTAVISASTPANDTYKADTRSFTLEVVSLNGTGEEDSPYTVSDVVALKNTHSGKAWVKGTIVNGYADNKSTSNPTGISATSSYSKTHVVLSEDGTESEANIAIELPTGHIRNAVNISDNASNASKQLTVYGDLQLYYGRPGLKSTEKAQLEGLTQFKVSAAGWCTYYTDVAFEMPADAQGIIALESTASKLMLTRKYQEGDIVPANTPLLIEAPQATYVYSIVNSTASAPTGNYLHGNLTAGTIAEVEGANLYFKLAYVNEVVGWYYGAENGARFTMGAHKAYLAISSTLEAPSFDMIEDATDETTGIEAISTEEAATKAVKVFENGQVVIILDGVRYNVLGQLIR